MDDVFCELFVDSLKNHIKEVSLNLLWWNFLHDKEMLNYVEGSLFIYWDVCMRCGGLLPAPPSSRTCSLGKGMQEAECFCPPACFQSPGLGSQTSQSSQLPETEQGEGFLWCRITLMAPCWLAEVLLGLYCSSTFPSAQSCFPLFLLQTLIPNKCSISQTQSQCLLWGNLPCDNMIVFPLLCSCNELY